MISKEIKDIEIGTQFIYGGMKYTKFNENNLCINDEYDESFMHCIFDPISNDYKTSLVREYINSERFYKRLGVNIDDLEIVYYSDKIVILFGDHYAHFKHSIRNYSVWWMLAGGVKGERDDGFHFVDGHGEISKNNVSLNFGIRVVICLREDIKVELVEDE